MGVPDFQTLMLPLLKLAEDGGEHTFREAIDSLSDQYQLTEEERREVNPSGARRIDNRVGWARTYLVKAGMLSSVRRGAFQITERGRGVLAEKPPRIDLTFLKTRSPEVAAGRAERDEERARFDPNEGAWVLRAPVEERVREHMERAIPDADQRRAALELLAFAIEKADEERSEGWLVRETSAGARLMTGRLLACEIGRKRLRVSVVGPISDELRARLGADSESDDEFASIPGGLLLTFPVERVLGDVEELKTGLDSFIDLAMARLRRVLTLEDHVPELVSYVAKAVARDLPQPQPTEELEESGAAEGDKEERASHDPVVRGRTQVFERGERTLMSLMDDVGRDLIALPDLQRPFVWDDSQVRDLLDSLFLGFPVGTLVLWHTAHEKESRALGDERSTHRATTLVIDGQQRLTSLSAVIRGQAVLGKDWAKRTIAIAFRPRDGRFEVSDAAIRHDPEFLPNVTELWTGQRQSSQIRRELLNNLRDQGRAIDEKYEDAVERNLEIARGLGNYRFPTIEIREGAEDAGSEERMSEIFVRINNQGKRLGQADFVLTLLAVFHGELRDRIEARAREMSEDGPVAVDTQQLLRAACGVAFDRARMSAVYRYLRGIDPVSGETNSTQRQDMIARLDEAADACLDPTPWRDYLLRVKHAGFVSSRLVASRSAIVNGYAMYIRGRRAGVPKNQLDELVTRWVFGALLSARYSASSETAFEQDLARVSGVDSEGFVSALDGALGQTLAGDYWTLGLVGALETQKPRSPAALSFRAAQVVLGARALFSDLYLRDMLDPPPGGGRAAAELHHLFPIAWLAGQGIRDRRRHNQVANLADVAWSDNSSIGAHGPSRYVPRLREKLGLDDDRWGRMCAEHALPLGWETMEYEAFLSERRRRMADIIRLAFRKLGGDSDTATIAPPWFLPGAELVWQNIAAAERGLRAIVRELYQRFGDGAAARIEAALSEREREQLTRALRARPAGSDPLTVVDYLYLAQLPPLLFAGDVWQEARVRFGGDKDVKQRLQRVISDIMPVRNEIAHVREVERDRLLRADLACKELLKMLSPGA